MRFTLILVAILSVFSSTVFAKTLVITDSHGEGAFGSELVSMLEKQDDTVSLYAVGGSTSADWNHGLQQIWGYWEYHTGKAEVRSTKPVTPMLKTLLETQSPDRLIIELGTNLIWSEIPQQGKDEISNMLATVRQSGVQCYWIGPPDLRPNKMDRIPRELEIHSILEQLVVGQGCELVKSWSFTRFPNSGGDGIHYDTIPLIGKDLSRQWARDAVQRVFGSMPVSQ
jgi:hypothetical protein